jgi:ribosomal protein L12E/L44/L45/RPP1/RPP2
MRGTCYQMLGRTPVAGSADPAVTAAVEASKEKAKEEGKEEKDDNMVLSLSIVFISQY